MILFWTDSLTWTARERSSMVGMVKGNIMIPLAAERIWRILTPDAYMASLEYEQQQNPTTKRIVRQISHDIDCKGQDITADSMHTS